jgi:hypothetical protein
MVDMSCLKCGYIFNCFSDATGGQAMPKNGDLSVCLKCGAVGVFTENKKIVALTKIGYTALSTEKKILLKKIECARREVMTEERKK